MERSRKVQDSLYRLERGLNPFSLWPPEAGVSSAPARAHGVKQFDVLPPMARNILLISTTLPIAYHPANRYFCTLAQHDWIT
jgi:hypothetical protein